MISRSVSSRAKQFTGSSIMNIARLALEHNAINLALGTPDFPAPDEIKESAVQAIRDNINQYANTWGIRPLREAIAEKVRWHMDVELDPETDITITCGATEALVDVLMATVNPGDEVIIFEPSYETFIPATLLSGATPRCVPLHRPDWCFDEKELAAAFNTRTKAFILNTPHNPTGKVFSREELRFIADLCQKWNVLCVTDEVYEHMVYDNLDHISLLQFEDMRERTIVINAMSKTYCVTGWRIGYVIAPPEITDTIRAIHDLITCGTVAPLQIAGVKAFQMSKSYYQNLRLHYQACRNYIVPVLEELGFVCYRPQGSCYVMAAISNFRFFDDIEFVTFLIKEIGVATIPGSSFYSNPATGGDMVRFCFSKKRATLVAAEERLARLANYRKR